MLTPNEAQIDAHLSTLGTEIMNTPNGPIANLILPPIDIPDKITFEYREFGAEHASAHTDDLVGPTGETNEIGHTLGKKTGTMIERGLHEVLALDILEVQKPPDNGLEDATRTIISQLMIKKEKRVEALVNDTAVLPHATPSIKWNGTTPTILKDIRTGKKAFKTQSGIEPNIMVVTDSVFSVMLDDPVISKILMHWRPELLFGSGIFPVIENMRVLIPGMQANNAAAGLTVAMADIWTKDNVIMAHVNPVPSSKVFTFGWQFQRKFSDIWNTIIRKEFQPKQNAWWIDARYWSVEKIVSTNAVYILNDVLT